MDEHFVCCQAGQRCPAGTLTAVMGPSGAGKTTLLNILSGHYDRGYEGEVRVNGWVRNTELFNRQSCYVMQDDVLLPELTVRESLDMSIRLRMPSLPPAKRAHLVNEALSKWGLGECQNTRAGNLSGGQRKRLSIAQELVRKPPVIFLDEPTSGLDSSTALRCVSVMKSFASDGHTVICSVHNPSARLFSYFDVLYMISGGRCIYNGSVRALVPFLESQGLHCPMRHNPADYITEIACGENGEVQTELSKHFTPPCTDAYKEIATHPTESRTLYGGRVMTRKELQDALSRHQENISYVVQFLVLLRRSFLCTVRNKVATHLRLAVYLSFALMLTAQFYGIGNEAARATNNLAFLVLTIAMLLFQSTMPTVMVFPTELRVLLREHRNCWYKPAMYYIARVLTEIPFLLLGPTMMVLIVYWATAQPAELWRLTSVILLSLQTCATTQGLALIVSAASSTQTALFMALPASAPSFLFSGYFMPPKLLQPPVAWFTYTSHCYHALHGILYAIYGSDRGELACNEDTFCFFAEPKQVLIEMGAEDAFVHVKFGILLAMDIFYKVIAYVILRWRLRLKM
ncbi:ATP-binding cassette sub-family G member 1-like isoform X2 [Amblyomma americanum]